MGRRRAVRSGGGEDDSNKNTTPPPQPTRRTRRELKEIETNESAAGLTRDILFGRCVQGLKLIYANAFDNGNLLYLVAAIGEGPLKGIYPRIDDKNMSYNGGAANTTAGARYIGTTSYIQAWVYDGSVTPDVSASLLTTYHPGWNANAAAYNNLAIAVFKLQFNEYYLSSVPKITFDIEGYRDVYDPRTGTRGYTENAALVIREVMTNTRWGMKIPAANIDDTTFSTAANDCAAGIFPATPTTTLSATQTATAGNLNGQYMYRITNVNANGVETAGSPTPVAYAVIGASGNLRNSVVTIPVGDSLTVTRRLYRATNTQPGVFRLVATIAENTSTSYTDSMVDATWGAQPLLNTVAPLTNMRYPIGINVSRQATAADWLDTLRAHCLGVFTMEDGKYQLRIDNPLPAGYVKQKYSENHNWGGNGEKPNVVPDSIRWGRKKRSELFNEVEVKYTDLQNNHAEGSVVKSRQAVINGTEIARRATYDLPGLYDSSVAARLATQILNLAWDDAWFEWEADRSALETMPWDVVQLTGGGLVNQDVRVRSVSASANGFTISGTEYNPASYSDAIVQADAPLTGGSIGVVLVDNLNPPTNLNVTEVVDEPQPGVFFPKLVVTFTPNLSPKYGGTVLRYTVAGQAEKTYGTFYYSPVTIPMPEPGKAITIRATTMHKSGQEGSTSATYNYTMYDPSNPEPIYDILVTNGEAYWGDPPVRQAPNLNNAAWWTATGTSLFTAAAIANGDLTTAALAFNVAGAGTLRVDAQNALSFREVELHWVDTASRPSFGVEYSDDGTTFTPVSTGIVDSAPMRTVYMIPSGTGPHRYWRLVKAGTTALTGRIAEVRFKTYTGSSYPYIKGYRLTGYTPGGTGAKYSKDITLRPTATTNRVPLSEFMYSYSFSDPVNNSFSGGSSTELFVQTISPTNVISDGRKYSAASAYASTGMPGDQDFLPLGETSYAPVTGNNVDIGVFANNLVDVLRLTGSNAGWVLGGFTGGYAGRIVTIINATTVEGTIANEDAGTSAAARITLPDAASTTLPPGGTMALVYDATSTRWRRFDRHTNALDRIRALSTGYGSLDVKGTLNGYSGIHFPDQQRVLMMNSTYQGVYNTAGAWQWYWNNGTLEAGTVPGSRISAPRSAWVNNAPVVAQELGWRYYGNNHTVVDNSAAQYRPNQSDPDAEWTVQYPTLMGFNGSATYGVRVDRSRYAEHLKANATVASSPVAADDSTKVATTAWVRANGGGGMERVAQMNPASPAGANDGITTVGNRPRGFVYNAGYSNTVTNTAIVSITGKGVLRYFSAGGYNNSAAPYITLVIDGTTIMNDVNVGYLPLHYGNAGFNTVFVGSLVGTTDPATSDYYLSVVPSDYGITFKTSLTIYARVSSAASYCYVYYAYALY